MMAVRCIALDFDGVVIESVQVKLQAFKRLFSAEASTARIEAYLEENHGVDRYTKFRRVWTDFLGRPYDADVERALDDRFSDMVLQAVLTCPYVPGAVEFLTKAEVPLYVVSAMPLRDLRLIVESRRLSDRFRGLYGAPGRKADQIREILARERLSPSECLFVGDSLGDMRAARESGVRFIGRRNEDEFEAGTLVVSDLHGLTEAIAALPRAG